ncbi:transketolase [Crossiella sp. SN42]|uniref:transketolase n=1 Tax=Crossiella sp. SN42 TaxID=2944808 RepID=UPI00207D2E4E|nr:transketolase [Crossiella sp. SN42]MCO1580282.1 transketolase [Crossiella sp. SN42]
MTTPQQLRREAIRMTAHAETGHIPSNLSAIEIIHTLFMRVLKLDPERPDWPDRDRFIPSKGHCAAAIYLAMAAAGLFDRKRLDAFNVDGGEVPAILARYGLPGLEADSGPLGRGISIGIGVALAAKHDNRDYRTYVLVGDGECQEGQIWEAAMLAPTLKLDNLVVIVDDNRLQGSFVTSEVIESKLDEQFAAFGWQVHRVDGHSVEELEEALRAPQDRPKVVLATTVKGKGVAMMEHEPDWHYRRLTFSELVVSLRGLR